MKLKILALSFYFGLLISCGTDIDDNNQCIQNEIAYVTSVNSPTSGIVNEIINIEVKFGAHNGCGDFGRFIEIEDGNTRIIEVEAIYIGCICTENAPIITTNYEFIANNTGNYELKFKSGPTDFITVNLTIN